MKFRKKPLVVEAEQYRPIEFNGHPNCPKDICICASDECGRSPHVHTLEGAIRVSPRDWIITGIKGEVYPCKPDVFEATYERIDD